MNFEKFDYNKILDLDLDSFLNDYDVSTIAKMDIGKLEESKLSDKAYQLVQQQVGSIEKDPELKGNKQAEILIENKNYLDILVKKPKNIFFNTKTHLKLLEKTDPKFYKFIPRVDYRAKYKGNRHQNLHNERIYLMEQALLYATGFRDSHELTRMKIACISEPAELMMKIGYAGNLFINQCDCAMSSDEDRFENLVKKLPAVYLKSILTGYAKENQLNLKTFISNICNCKLGDKLCKHILNFRPSILVLPHSIYYLTDKLIAEALLVVKKIVFVAHVFKDGVTSGVIPGPIADQVEWTNINDQITFNVLDDKIYSHQNVLNFLYDRNYLDFGDYDIKVINSIEYGGCKHISGIITRRNNNNAITFAKYLPIQTAVSMSGIKPINNYVLTNKKSINNIIKNYKKDAVYILNVNAETKNYEEDKILIKMVDSTIKFTPFRSGHAKLVDFFNFFTKDESTLEKPLCDSMVQCIEMVSQTGSAQMDLSLYNNLVAICLQLKTINDDNLKILSARIIQNLGSKITNLAVIPIILDNIVSDTLLLNVSVNSILSSDKVKLFNTITYKKDFTLLDRFYDCLFGKKKVDTKFKEVKSTPFNEKRKQHLLGVDITKTGSNSYNIKDLNGMHTTSYYFTLVNNELLTTNAIVSYGACYGSGISTKSYNVYDLQPDTQHYFIQIMGKPVNAKPVKYKPRNVIKIKDIITIQNPNADFQKVVKDKKNKNKTKLVTPPQFVKVKNVKKYVEEDWTYDTNLAFLNLFVGNKKIDEIDNKGDFNQLNYLPNLILPEKDKKMIDDLQFLNTVYKENYCGILSILPALITLGFRLSLSTGRLCLENCISQISNWLQVHNYPVYDVLKNSLRTDSSFVKPTMKQIVHALNLLNFDALITRVGVDKLSTFEFSCNGSRGAVLLLLYNNHVEWYSGYNTYIPFLAFNSLHVSQSLNL